MLHVLWECGVPHDVWAGNRIGLQKSAIAYSDIKQLVEDLMGRLTAEDLDMFLVQYC